MIDREDVGVFFTGTDLLRGIVLPGGRVLAVDREDVRIDMRLRRDVQPSCRPTVPKLDEALHVPGSGDYDYKTDLAAAACLWVLGEEAYVRMVKEAWRAPEVAVGHPDYGDCVYYERGRFRVAPGSRDRRLDAGLRLAVERWLVDRRLGRGRS